jgi:transcriptional regulator with GAF, ATPase, and Fis domain
MQHVGHSSVHWLPTLHFVPENGYTSSPLNTERTLVSSPRKIVFNVPSLLPDAGRARAADPAAREAAPAAEAGPEVEGGEDARKLAMLVEVSQALTGTLKLQAGLYGVLEVLERRCGALRGAVTLLEEASGMLVVEAALGYPRPSGRVRYRIGEGVTGLVAQSGTPAVVPRVSRDPRFLHRAAERAQRGDEITFICVPISLDGGTVGTLGIERRYVPGHDGDRTVSALRITAGMIAQALRIQRLIDAERRQPVDARLHGRSIKRISTPAIDMMVSYHWPGNVRELENTIERAVLVADGDVIHGHHLSPTLQTAEASGTVVSGSLGEAVAAFEGNLIQDALKTTRGNRARAARLLNTTERIINYKIRRYGIDPRRFRG